MGTVVSLEARRQGRSSARARGGRGPRTTFWFDLADPGTYLAAERVDRLFAGVDWTPASLPASSPRPVDLDPQETAAVLARAASLRMPLVWPERHPAARPRAMRAAAYAASEGRAVEFVLAASRLAFCGGFDLEDPEVLAEAAAAASLPLRACLAAAADPRRDDAIRAAGERLVAVGVQRLPVVSVGRIVFAGEERIPEAVAARRDPTAAAR